MRAFAILLAVLLSALDSSALWVEFGDWANPFTWLIWFTPMPIVLRRPNTCEVSQWFKPITVRDKK